MKSLTFWKTVTADTSDFLERILALLSENSIRHCVIGGQGVNAYADPVVSLDLDLVVAVDQLERVEQLLRSAFKVQRCPFSINAESPGSNLRVQIQTDPRYFDFVERAQPREVLGLTLPVADIRDILRGKIWAATDPTRRRSKHLKDLADIARILEAEPALSSDVPPEVLSQVT